MARLLITNGVQQGRVLRLKPGVNRIGRSVENHFQIPDPSISASHCEVVFSEASVLVRDLNSTNGTWIDGEPIREHSIRIGQIMQLGGIELKLEDTAVFGEAAAVTVPELTTGRPAAPNVLENGSPACVNHPGMAGVYHCTKCEETLCEYCVRVVQRLSGGTLVFCSICSGMCEALFPPPADEPVVQPAAKTGLFGRVRETIKLAFKRP